MVGIQWPDSVSSQVGPSQGRTSRPSSNAGTAPKPKVDGTLARSPSWPHAQRAGSPPAGSGSLARSASGHGSLYRAEDTAASQEVSLADPGGPLGDQPQQSIQAVKTLTPPSQMRGGVSYPGSVMYLPEGMPEVHNDAGSGAPRPGRQAMDAVLRRPDGELTGNSSGKSAVSEVSLPRSGAGAGDEGSRSRARLATVVEASPPATVEQVPRDGSATTGPELLDTERSPGPSTYSDARDSQTRSPLGGRRSREGGEADTRSNASRARREKLRLPDFMVHMPAGSGCGTSDLPSNSTFVDVEKAGSYILESQGVVRPGTGVPSCRRCVDFEAKIKAMRSEFAEEIARERMERQQQVQGLEEKLRRTQIAAAEEEARLKKEMEALGKSAAESSEASMARLREELNSEIAVAESAGRREQAGASEHELAEAQKQRDDFRKKFISAKSAHAEAERQRQGLLKQSSTQVANTLREDLEKAGKDNDEYLKKMRKMVPTLQKFKDEGERLRTQLSEQTEMAAMNGRLFKTESQEMTKAQDNFKRQKRSLHGQVTTLNTEIEEMKTKVKDAKDEVTREQRLRLDENRKQGNAKAEIKRLRSELENTELALQQQAQAAYMAAAAQPHQQMWAVDPRVAAAVNPRAAPSHLPRGTNLMPHGRTVSPQPGHGVAGIASGLGMPVRGGGAAPGVMAAAALAPPVGSAVAARVRTASDDARAAAASAMAARSVGWPAEMEDPSALSPLAANGASPSGDFSHMEQLWVPAGESGSMPESPMGGFRGGPGSPMVAPSSPAPVSTNGVTITNSASQRLFDVIEKAKERADARRLLTGAAEEVRVKAQALEELLENDVVGF